MSNDPTTEADLRGALRTLVPDDLDATDFRARLDRLLAEQPGGSSASTAATEDDLVVVLADAASRRRRPRTALVVTLAACAAAVLAIAIAVVPHGGRHRSTPVTDHGVPASLQGLVNPGSIALRTYRGRGSQSFAVAPRTLPTHTGYSAYGTCRGGGNLTIGEQTLFGVCTAGSGTFGTGDAVADGRFTVTADPGTSWRLTLLIEPDARTNGSVQAPVDADLTGPDTAVRQHGTGTRTVQFTGDPSEPPSGAAVNYRVRLMCRGSGVRLPGLSAPRANGLSTQTCFAGREYVWTYVRLAVPATVRVVAAAGTTWTVVVDPM